MKQISRQLALFSVFLFNFSTTALSQVSGLNAPVSIGAYLNGTLPSVEPGSATGFSTANAFPNLSFIDPLWLTPIPGTGDFLVVGKNGQIWRFPNNPNATQAQVVNVLDWASKTQTSGDQGFYSLVFHPQFNQVGSPNRNFAYVCYNHRPALPGAGPDFSYWRVSRFTWIPASGTFDPASEFVLINQFDPDSVHNGGAMFFDNAGFLNISSGDGGDGPGGGYVGGGINRSQKLNGGFFSGLFRIDVDNSPTNSHAIRRQPLGPTPPAGWPASSTQGYRVPNSNPFQNTNGSILEEYSALGLRSPHTAHYDPVEDETWLGDVGLASREEVTRLIRGSNAQWGYKEGRVNAIGSPAVPPIGIDTPPYVDYDHSVGISIIGGMRYRGSKWNATLGGRLIYGDHVTGKIWSIPVTSGATPAPQLIVDRFPTGNKIGLANFCTDASGEIYLMTVNGTNRPGGTIRKLVATGASLEPPTLLSQTGVFSNMTTLTTAPGIIPYSTATPLWSDGAAKRRWIALPNNGTHNSAAEDIVFSEDGPWLFPAGTVLIKHFEIGTNENNPAQVKRLETRLIVCTPNGGKYGVTYKWNAAGTDATLLTTGLNEDFTITKAGGGTVTQRWSYPSRGECIQCHTAGAGQALGVRTAPLNMDILYSATNRTANQLLTFNSLGMFDRTLSATELENFIAARAIEDTTAPLEHRVRSYLDSNCSHCHQPDSSVPFFDARLETPLIAQGIINGNLEGHFSLPNGVYIKPGNTALSAIHLRSNNVGNGLAMPPIAKNVLDQSAVNLLTQYINGLNESQFQTPQARYVRLTALSSVNNSAWTSVAEFSILDQAGTPIASPQLAIHAFDSQELVGQNAPATHAIDGNIDTYWHTPWSPAVDPAPPHFITVDLGSVRSIGGYTYTPRQDSAAGRIANYQTHYSTDGTNWQLMDAGTWPNDATPKTFTGLVGYRKARCEIAGPAQTASNSPFNVTIAFDTDVTDFTLTDIQVTGGSVTRLRGSGYYYVATISPSAQSVSVNIPADVASISKLGNFASNALSISANLTGPPNTAPVAVADSYSVPQNGSLVIPSAGVLANDTDAQAHALTAVLVNGVSNGTLTLNSNGGFTYTPTADFIGTDSFTYRANDGNLNSNTVVVNLSVNLVIPGSIVNGSFESDFQNWVLSGSTGIQSSAPYIAREGSKMAVLNGANQPPNGVISQTFPTVSGQTYTLEFDAGVLAYNGMAQLMQVTVTGSSSLLSRTLNLTGATNGDLRWFPQSFTFVANSASTTLSFRDQSTLTAGIDLLLENVRVTGQSIAPNSRPVAVADSYSTNQNTPLVVPNAGVLSNDTDADNQALTATVVTGPTQGTLALNPSGGFTYTPTLATFTGTDSFTYQASDGTLSSTAATVTLTVNPVAPGPPVSQSLLNGSFESDFQSWTTSGSFGIQSSPPYIPRNGSKMAVFNGGNQAPNALISQTFATTAGQTYTLEFDAGVLAYNGLPQVLQVTATGSGSLLSRTLNLTGAANGDLRWFPQSFTFVANSPSTTLSFRDQSATTAGIDLLLDHVRISGGPLPPNTNPVAVADSYSTQQNTPLTVPNAGVLSNDTDAENQTLTAAIVTPPTQGSLVLNPAGGFTYTPTLATFSGTDTFTYQANDGSLNSAPATVTITINATLPVDPGPPLAQSLLNGSFESDFTHWTRTGNLTIQQAPTYQATDAAKVVAFNSGNLAPNGVLSQTFATNEGQSYTLMFDVGVFAYNNAPQVMQISVTGTGNSSLLSQTVTVTGAGSGINRWTPQRFEFIANGTSTTLAFRDQSTTSSSIDLLLDNVRLTTAGPVGNTAPVAVADSYATSRNRVLTITLPGVLANDTDQQANLLTAIIETTPRNGTLVLNSNGSFTYTPGLDYIGPDSFTYRANDGYLNSAPALVNLSVNAIPNGIKIMPLGDSITLGSTSANAGYRGELFTLLSPIAEGFQFVGTSSQNQGSLPSQPINQRYHEGHSSYTILNVFNNLDGFDDSTFLAYGGPERNPNGGFWLTGLESINRAPLFPDVITLAIGTNDTPDLTGVDERLEALIEKITTLRPDTKLLVAKITPLPANQANVNTYNSMVTSIVADFRAAGKNVYLVDLSTGFPNNGLHSDGVHPNDTGYRWMATRWLEAIVSAYTPVVEIVNTAPVATPDTYSTVQATELVVTGSGVLGNDTDAQADPLAAALVTGPSNGTLTLNPDGSFSYTPEATFVGSDSFTYLANDGTLDSSAATVTITVNAVAPVLPVSVTNGSFEAGLEGWTGTGNLAIQGPPTYQLTDGTKLVVFNGANQAPNGTLSQTFATTAGQNYRLTFDAGTFAYNADPQVMQVTVTGVGNLLTRTINLNGAGAGITRWTPQTFTFVANSTTSTVMFQDRSSTSAAIDLLLDKVRVTEVANIPNVAPSAVADSFSTAQGVALTVPAPGVLTNDSDPESAPLTAVLETPTANGTTVLNPDGSFIYTPTGNFVGQDSFTYRARDATLGSGITTVTITVNAVVPVALINGSFENGLTGWTTSGHMDIRASAPYVPTQGANLLALNTNNRTPNGIISQAFATTPGQSYTLRFDVGALSYNLLAQSVQVTVTGSSSLLSRSITFNGLGNGSNRWLPQMFTFVANTNLTTLTFRDTSPTSSAIDLLLDNVRIEGQSPQAAALPTTQLVLTSPEKPEPPTISTIPGASQIRMNVSRPGIYQLQRSEDFLKWDRVEEKEITAEHVLEIGTVEFTDDQEARNSLPPKSKMFYRIRLPDAPAEN